MYDWNFFDNISEYHPMADANNLYDGFYRSRIGSHSKASVKKFRWNRLKEIRKLQIELESLNKNEDDDNAYKLSKYTKFFVNERGKIRAITALCIRDRIVKHVLNDVFLLPHITPYLIYDNGASLKGKGVSFTRNRIIAHLQKYYRQYQSNEGYFMSMDFSGYYDNIDHFKAMQFIKKYEPDVFVQKLCWQAFDSYKIDVSYMNNEEYNNCRTTKFSMVEYRKNHVLFDDNVINKKYLNKSLSVGDQTSQITAIAFPTPIDNMIKIVNKCHYYARYMDDFYIISNNMEEIRKIQKDVCEKAQDMKLFINDKKTQIIKLKNTFTFMQLKYYLKDNGYVVVRINSKTVSRMRRKLKKLKKLYDKKEVSKEQIASLFRSWIQNFRKYMSKIQIKNLINLYQNLYGNDLDVWLQNKKLLKL